MHINNIFKTNAGKHNPEERNKVGGAKKENHIQKRQKRDYITDIIAALILFIISIIIINHYKAPFLHFWDEYLYIKIIISQDIKSYTFPRAAYFEFYAFIWKIVRHFNADPFEFHNTMRTINIIFASAAISMNYLFINSLTKKRIFAVGTSLLLLSTPFYIRYSGTTLQEIMMLFFIILSFYLFTSAIKENKIYRLYLAAISFGIACSVREQAIAFLLFFIVLGLAEPKGRQIAKKAYLLAAITYIASFLVPIMYTYHKDSYFSGIIHYIKLTRSYGVIDSLTTESVSTHISLVIKSLTMSSGNIIFMLSLLGLILLYDKNKPKELAYILTLFVPVTILIFFGGHTPRHYLCTLLGLTISAMYAIEIISKSIVSNTKIRKSIILLAVVLLIFSCNIHTADTRINNENKDIVHYKAYWEQISTEFPNNTVFMIGHNTAIMKYYSTLGHSNNTILMVNYPGNSGPLEPKSKEELEQTINSYLSQNKTIIIDTDNSYRRHPLDIEQIKDRYSPEVIDTLLIIKPS